ncbi:MAG: amidohydrolase family protein [Methanobacterium sp.]|jgi:predicted TIM-barrel fold metal-dependent hydrolase
MRTIALEETYATPAFMENIEKNFKTQAKTDGNPQSPPAFLTQIAGKLINVGESRIKEMNQAGIDVQVLSLFSPGVEQLEASIAVKIAEETNDYIADKIQQYPTRFAGFATLPTPVPETAADELERVVKDYDFKGGIINGHSKGRYLDDEFFWPILERAEALKVPIYLHPTLPPQAVIEASYTGNFTSEVATILARNAWGWHIETAIHILRIILSGAFDQYPKLQFIIGHMGEGLPFMLQRIDRSLPKEVIKLEKSVAEYLRENINYTFSGLNYTQTFLDLFLEVGADRIMFSTDYPFVPMEETRTFLDQLPVSTADKEKIAHGNAEKLLHL